MYFRSEVYMNFGLYEATELSIVSRCSHFRGIIRRLSDKVNQVLKILLLVVSVVLALRQRRNEFWSP